MGHAIDSAIYAYNVLAKLLGTLRRLARMWVGY